MAKVMISIQSSGHPPTLEDVQKRYGLTSHELDTQFGVVEIDPATHTYTILIEESAVAKIVSNKDWKVNGPYANPPIEPFGPPSQ